MSIFQKHFEEDLLHKKCAYILYTTDVYKMYAKFQQTFADLLYTKSKELCQLNFVYTMWTKVCRNVGYILYTNSLYTICIHQFWSTECVHHKHCVYNLYTKFMQNVCTNNCIKNRSLISTFFDPFVVHFQVNHCKQLCLRLETCWLIKSMDYWIIYCMKLPVIKLNKSKCPCISGKNAKFV